MMKNALRLILIIWIIWIVVPVRLFAAATVPIPIEFFGADIPFEDYEYVGGATGDYNTDYWHYSGGYWVDGARKETRILDSQPEFWSNPEMYADRLGMQINTSVALPESVKMLLSAGEEITVSVTPENLDAFNLDFEPIYWFDLEKLYIKALPQFVIDWSAQYDRFVNDLDEFIPIVLDGYGWNVYAVYLGNEKLGELESSFVPDPERIEFTDILDKQGHLKPGKTFHIRNRETGIVTTARSEDITIGDGTFNSAGAVGMWFNYPYGVRFYKKAKKPVDFQVLTHAPRRVPVGKPVKSSLQITNNSQVAFSDDTVPLEIIVNGQSTVYAISLGAGEEKTVTFDWVAPTRSGPVQITAAINKDKTIKETDYTNNIRQFTVDVYQDVAPLPEPLPDFSLTAFRETHYPASSVVESFIRVKNNSTKAYTGLTLEFFDGQNLRNKTVDLAANEEKEIGFSWMTPDSPGAVHAWAQINAAKKPEESDYTNNKIDVVVDIEDLPTDLSIHDVLPSKYPAGKQVLTLVEIKNDGERNFAEGTPVTVGLKIPYLGLSLSKLIFIDRNATQYVPFLWTTPSNNTSFTITASVNEDGEITETRYDNNSKSITAQITKPVNPIFGCNTTRREWTELRFSHNQDVIVVAGGVPFEIKMPVFIDMLFYAEVSLSVRLVPDTMKSGYGVECEVTASVDTNYDKPEEVTNIQSIYAYAPTSAYGEAIELERVPGTDNRWRFPVNSASIKGSRVLFVPVEWPDHSAFNIGFTGRDALCPGGAMCVSTFAEVMIIGNMYEDDYTAPHYK